MSLKKVFKSWRTWFLIFWLLVAFLCINYQFGAEGVVIDSVEQNSSAYIAGIQNPDANAKPTDKEYIVEIDNNKIKSVQDFYDITSLIKPSAIFKLTTNKETYSLIKEENKSLGLSISERPSSNIRKGLDLQGGTRAVLKPMGEVSDSDIKDVIDTMSNRLNVYGLKDLTIKSASDLENNKYIIVEIAGATKEDVKELIAKQGKFEAKIGDELVFSGGKEDIPFVCRTDGSCSRISECLPAQNGGYACKFEFQISLSEKAAERHAEVTKNIEVNVTEGGHKILNKKIDFYLDNSLVSSLNIDADLKGQKATAILITGSELGKTKQEAVQNTIKERDKLQTILITGSLPTKIEIQKLDTISPVLGKQFLSNAWLVGLVAVIGVALVVAIRYKSPKIVAGIMITMLSEIFLILGFAALFKYNLDLAAIAAIIAAVGTGVDDQIVITDEIMSKEAKSYGGLTERVKRAFFIIMIAYAATVASMLPLLWAGVGLLTGFAIVTIVGVSVGVFITRPAYGAILKALMED